MNRAAVLQDHSFLDEPVKKTSLLKVVAKRLSKNKLAMTGLLIFLVLALLAAISPYIIPYGYDQIDMTVRLQPPSLAHPFGTDHLGRDLFSRILYGGRFSLSLGIFAMGLAVIMSVIVGATAGFFGGWVDIILMRILDILQALPTIFLAILISALLGNGYGTTIVALAVPRVASFSRLIRAQFLKMSSEEYVEAARSIGSNRVTIMMRHIMPNALQPLIVSATMGLANTVLQAASLSFIGLGIQSPTPEWGAMLSGARDFMRDYPWLVIVPGIFIFITVLSVNLFGDGIRDALDPKLKD